MVALIRTYLSLTPSLALTHTSIMLLVAAGVGCGGAGTWFATFTSTSLYDVSTSSIWDVAVMIVADALVISFTAVSTFTATDATASASCLVYLHCDLLGLLHESFGVDSELGIDS